MKKSDCITPQRHSDIEYIKGLMHKDSRLEYEFYVYCKTYFNLHYRTVFFSADTYIQDIFQNSFIALWQNIESGKIHVEDGIIKGKDNKPLKCSLTTYLMSIARNKYKELSRSTKSEDCFVSLPTSELPDDELTLISDWLSDDYENAMLEVISESISVMSPRCSQLLTKFYYENKKLEEMMAEIPDYTSKDALKSNKNRCLKRLKEYAQQLYKIKKSRQ